MPSAISPSCLLDEQLLVHDVGESETGRGNGRTDADHQQQGAEDRHNEPEACLSV